MKNLEVRYEDQVIVLNKKLIQKQNLRWGRVLVIKEIHKDRMFLFGIMKLLLAEMNELEAQGRAWCGIQVLLRCLAKDVEEIEFDLQEAWGFEKDKKMHSWWWQLPGCSCPKLDNADMLGTNLRYTTEGCVYHSPEKAK